MAGQPHNRLRYDAGMEAPGSNETEAGRTRMADAIAREEATLSRQLEWIKAVDAKTPIIIGIDLALLAATAALAPKPNNIDPLPWVYVAMSSLPVLVCLICCIFA